MTTVAKYLINCLKKMGINHVFGVPGDYNLTFLDNLIEEQDIEWVGNVNELNAAYMADGYARTNGIAAMVSTYGVGELSTLNGIAGSYAEDVPIIHIVGVPCKQKILKNEILHHGLGDNRYDVFQSVAKKISCHQVWLDNKNAIAQIDEAIKHAVFNKKPSYIFLPTDIVDWQISNNQANLDFSFNLNKDGMENAVEDLLYKINEANQAILIVGHKVKSYGIKKQVNDFIEKSNLNATALMSGKGVIDETNEKFLGMYLGKNTYSKSLIDFIKDADLIICIGTKFSDLVAAENEQIVKNDKIFEINDDYIKYDSKVVSQTSMGAFLNLVNEREINYYGNSIENEIRINDFEPSEQKIKYDRFFEAFNTIIDDSTIIVSDVGTSMFGSVYLNMKKESNFILQPIWASIGFSFPASMGAKLANKNKKVFNFIGDGAFNMTFNELGTLMTKKIPLTTFMFNNNGYSVERVINGKKDEYNNIPQINYETLLKSFDANNNHLYYCVKTEDDLVKVFKTIEKNNDKFIFVEVILEEDDTPKEMENFF